MRTLSLSLLLTVLLLSSCGDDPVTSTPNTTTLGGTVVNSSGAPLSNAQIGLLFTFESSTLDTLFSDTFLLSPYPNPVVNDAVIGFEVPTAANVRADLLRYHTRDTVRNLLNETLAPGLHQLSASFDSLPNGGYIYLMRMNGVRDESLLIVNDPDTVNFTPLLTTDASGRFSLDRARLPIGQRIARTFENGQWGGYSVVAKKMGVVVRSGGSSHVEWVTVDEATDLSGLRVTL